jgi:hypothetical protein
MPMFRMATAPPQYALKPKELLNFLAGYHAASHGFTPICGFCYSFAVQSRARRKPRQGSPKAGWVELGKDQR